MRRCKLCVKFKTHCWRRTCDQYGGRRQRSSFTSICRGLCWTSAGYLPVNPRWRLPCTACRIPAASCWYCCKQATNKLQWNREPRADADQPPPIPRLSPQQVSQHIWHGSLGRVTCIWEIIPLTFPTAAGGERRSCFHARLRCLLRRPSSGVLSPGQDIAVALFYSIFSSYIFLLVPLPFCTFGQRSRRSTAWTRIGNNLLCLTAGVCARYVTPPTQACAVGGSGRWMHNSYFCVARFVVALYLFYLLAVFHFFCCIFSRWTS